MDSTNRYVVLDVETTGLSSKNGDRVIEIGAVAIKDQGIIAEFSSLIDVGKRIPFSVFKYYFFGQDLQDIQDLNYRNFSC